jgi:class 3 adenylate cyclase
MVSAVDLEAGVDKILAQSWTEREGHVVPETDDVALSGGAVRIEAAILYADMAESTKLVSDFDARTAARVMKSFLYCSSRLIRGNGGEIRSFDGDRVMGIFIGDAKNSSAAKCALQIKYAIDEIVRPKVEAKYPTLMANGFVVSHACGIDRSSIFAVRAGMRDSNDLIWVGRAAAVAAKLSTTRNRPYRSFITNDVFSMLRDDVKKGPKGQAMWEQVPTKQYGHVVYRSSWQWKP